MTEDCIKFMDRHRIDDGLLRELLYKKKYSEAYKQIINTRAKYEEVIHNVELLMNTIQLLDTEK